VKTSKLVADVATATNVCREKLNVKRRSGGLLGPPHLLGATVVPSLSAHVSSNVYRPTVTGALILSPDPLAGALIGAAVELLGLSPAFPHPAEGAAAALRRNRVTHVLIDCSDACVTDESVLGPAMMTGARLFLFGTDGALHVRHPAVARYQLRLISIPADLDRLAEILAIPASESTRRRRRPTAR
jgi:hypothetical protein